MEINSAQLRPGPTAHAKSIYNGLDCCVTMEVHEELQRQSNSDSVVYDFERAMQGPLLEIMLRGFLVDQYERQKGISETQTKITKLNDLLQSLALAVWDKPLNPRSSQQLKEFFYGAMRIPEIWTSQKGVKKLSMNRETLEKIDHYFHAMPVVATILALRDQYKQLEILTTEIDDDGRWRTSYNIGGTSTTRLSSSASAYGTGSNTQNVKPNLRRIFTADPGYKLCGIDLEQTESRDVGLLCGVLFDDWTYLDACEGGDLHTTTCKLIWPNLAWPGGKGDRELADEPFYRHYSRRDMSKRGGHGSNYMGTPFTMARHLKVPTKLMEDFQKSYFGAFPAIPRYHRWIAQQLQTQAKLTTPFGWTRHFFGRLNDDTTLREAIAAVPQSMTAHRMNLGLWRVWSKLGKDVQLLAQVHDAIYFQYPERFARDEPDLIAEVLSLLRVPLVAPNGRVVEVPGEAKVGWNWGNHHNPAKPTGDRNPYNPNGLTKFKGHDTRTRLTGLDRVA